MPASRVAKGAIAEIGKQTEKKKKKEPNDAAEKMEGLNSMEAKERVESMKMTTRKNGISSRMDCTTALFRLGNTLNQ